MIRNIALFSILLSVWGCSATDSAKNLDFDSFMENFGIYADTDAKDESQFETVPFEKAMNRTLQKSLGTQKIHFVAKYRGIVSQPEAFKGVAGFVNLNICSPSNTTNCSDLAILKEDKAETALVLKQDELVDIFGVLVESDSARTASGIEMKISAPYMHFRIFKIRKYDEAMNASNQKSQVTSQNLDETPSMRTVQEKLLELGYNPGTPDGISGPKTRDAIMKFQSDMGLAPTGQINQATIKALNL